MKKSVRSVSVEEVDLDEKLSDFRRQTGSALTQVELEIQDREDEELDERPQQVFHELSWACGASGL